jgi:hypothetical protein
MGNPANDFAGFYSWLGLEALKTALSGYQGEVDEKSIPWIRRRAFFRGLEDVVYGIEAGKPIYFESGKRTLEMILAV